MITKMTAKYTPVDLKSSLIETSRKRVVPLFFSRILADEN